MCCKISFYFVGSVCGGGDCVGHCTLFDGRQKNGNLGKRILTIP